VKVPPETAQPEVAEDVPSLIRRAYSRVTSAPGAWVGLDRVRAALAGVERDEVDAALRKLEREPDINIAPESDQKAGTLARVLLVGGGEPGSPASDRPVRFVVKKVHDGVCAQSVPAEGLDFGPGQRPRHVAEGVVLLARPCDDQ
jgi:hypothetical protein